jgi:NTF2 fold immunity protein of polymorphic toxin system component
MKVSYAGTAVFFIFSVSVGIVVGQEPSVPKLPHVSSGKLTKSGLDYQMPGPKEGYVPDKETAIKIAEVVLFRLTSEKTITRQRPYVVTQDENIWWVCGTGRPDELGSLFKIAISKQTAAVLYLEL